MILMKSKYNSLLKDLLIILLIILLIVLAAKKSLSSCENALYECNNYVKENCTIINYPKEKAYSFNTNFTLEISKEKEKKEKTK